MCEVARHLKTNQTRKTLTPCAIQRSACITYHVIGREKAKVVSEFVLKPGKNKIFDYLNSNENCDFEVGPLEKLTQEGQLMVYQHNGNWACMDTHRDSISLNNLWENDQAFWQA